MVIDVYCVPSSMSGNWNADLIWVITTYSISKWLDYFRLSKAKRKPYLVNWSFATFASLDVSYENMWQWFPLSLPMFLISSGSYRISLVQHVSKSMKLFFQILWDPNLKAYMYRRNKLWYWYFYSNGWVTYFVKGYEWSQYFEHAWWIPMLYHNVTWYFFCSISRH
jgi:hypothetical protein